MQATETTRDALRSSTSQFHPGAMLHAAWTDNRELLLIAGSFLAAGYLAQATTDTPGLMRDVFRESFSIMLSILFLPLPLALLVGRLQVRDGSGRFIPGVPGWRIAWSRFLDRYGNPLSLARALGAAVAMTVILNTFGSWKRVFPRFMPFSWDERLATLDRIVHGGVDPWRILQPLLGTGRTTLFLDDLYFTWASVVLPSMVALIWFAPTDLRRRGLVGIAFVWIGLGTIGATLLSSAGPCYYGYLAGGTDPFEPLLDYLRTVAADYPLYTTAMQDVAWSLHQSHRANIYSGISAMPSVHVAMGALLALVGWEWNRWLGAGFWVYTGLTLIATVHLGWHYAVDGYVSIILVGLFWWAFRRIGRPRPARGIPA